MNIKKRLDALETATQKDNDSVKLLIYDGDAERLAAEQEAKKHGGVVVMLPDNHRG